MEMNAIKAVYFVGIGGIGMSAIARYFLQKGLCVGGYDRTPSELTRKLQEEGARIHYEEDVEQIPSACRDKDACLVVYTPAIPCEHAELAYFKANGFEIEKRAQVLGALTRAHNGLCVAGTHGKTTTSSMAAHILHQSTWTAMPFWVASSRITVRITFFLRRATTWSLKPTSSTVLFIG